MEKRTRAHYRVPRTHGRAILGPQLDNHLVNKEEIFPIASYKYERESSSPPI